ncbi:MAG: hypothetical protein JNK47_14130 [Mesorhizobium sp.]|nr:hypothetical protein [Mesorhizobium sp.]MBL8578358.1 hypothetical protein [Mesorhizobium sp.]
MAEDLNRDPVTGKTNALNLDRREYEQLDTANAFKRFNAAKRRPNERRDDRDDGRS